VDHRLLVPRLVVAEAVAGLLEGLADAGDVAVPEDPEHPGEEGLLAPVALDVLLGQELDDGLRHRQPPRRGHRVLRSCRLSAVGASRRCRCFIPPTADSRQLS
jgi:hypothetical protein